MKVWFFQGQTNRFTLSYLAYSLEQQSENITYEMFTAANIDHCKFSSEDLVIFTFLTPEVKLVHQLIQKIKASQNPPYIIGGGPHVDGNPAYAIKTLGLDCAICGSAGANWLKYISDKILVSPKGVATGTIIYLPEVPSLDELLPLSTQYMFRPPLEIQRGCHRSCAFCRTGAYKKMYRSKESILNYLDNLKKINFKRVGYVTPSAFGTGPGSPQDHDEFLEWILKTTKSYGFDFFEWGIFPSEADPETVTPQRLQLIKQYCSNKKITLGCQSGSISQLKKINRHHDLESVVQACAYIKEAGYLPNVDFIIGFPNESHEERLETMRFIKKLGQRFGAHCQLHFFLPLPGTEMGHLRPTPLTEEFKMWLLQEEVNGVVKGAWKLHYQMIDEIAPYLELD